MKTQIKESYSGSFITIDNCLRLGNVDGLKFITENGIVKTAKKFVFSYGIPYLYWDEYKVGCLIPAINLRMYQKMKWI